MTWVVSLWVWGALSTDVGLVSTPTSHIAQVRVETPAADVRMRWRSTDDLAVAASYRFRGWTTHLGGVRVRSLSGFRSDRWIRETEFSGAARAHPISTTIGASSERGGWLSYERPQWRVGGGYVARRWWVEAFTQFPRAEAQVLISPEHLIASCRLGRWLTAGVRRTPTTTQLRLIADGRLSIAGHRVAVRATRAFGDAEGDGAEFGGARSGASLRIRIPGVVARTGWGGLGYRYHPHGVHRRSCPAGPSIVCGGLDRHHARSPPRAQWRRAHSAGAFVGLALRRGPPLSRWDSHARETRLPCDTCVVDGHVDVRRASRRRWLGVGARRSAPSRATLASGLGLASLPSVQTC